jgi:uncharacterized membrane protein
MTERKKRRFKLFKENLMTMFFLKILSKILNFMIGFNIRNNLSAIKKIPGYFYVPFFKKIRLEGCKSDNYWKKIITMLICIFCLKFLLNKISKKMERKIQRKNHEFPLEVLKIISIFFDIALEIYFLSFTIKTRKIKDINYYIFPFVFFSSVYFIYCYEIRKKPNTEIISGMSLIFLGILVFSKRETDIN